MYEVATLMVNVNGAKSWKPLHSKAIRRKADAIALADSQASYAAVNVACTNRVVYQNNRPHGGKQAFVPGCACPACAE